MVQSRFYHCCHCGNIVEMIHNAGVSMICCGEKMYPLPLNREDASPEKHLPVVELENGVLRVRVGQAPHPMTLEHYIQWIYVKTPTGSMYRYLEPGQTPEAVFCLGAEQPSAVYAYCNIHGLWMTEL